MDGFLSSYWSVQVLLGPSLAVPYIWFCPFWSRCLLAFFFFGVILSFWSRILVFLFVLLAFSLGFFCPLFHSVPFASPPIGYLAFVMSVGILCPFSSCPVSPIFLPRLLLVLLPALNICVSPFLPGPPPSSFVFPPLIFTRFHAAFLFLASLFCVLLSPPVFPNFFLHPSFYFSSSIVLFVFRSLSLPLCIISNSFP